MELFIEGSAKESLAVKPTTSLPTELNEATGQAIAVALEAKPIIQSGAFAMIQEAIRNKFDADQLSKVFDLQDRMEKKAAAEAFGSAMNSAQIEMPVIVKDRQGNKSKFATLENVNNQIRPIYTKHGFSLSFGAKNSATANHVGVYCDVRHIGGHCERYDNDFPLDLDGAKGNANKNGIQAMGSTISYARRYLTLLIFNITVAEEDNDGSNSSDAKITEKQIFEINDRIEDLRKRGAIKDADFFKKFLAWLKVDDLSKLTVLGFAQAIGQLQRKLDEAKAAEAKSAKEGAAK